MSKIVSLKIETCVSIFLLQKRFSQIIRSRAFCMLDTFEFCNPIQGVGIVEDTRYWDQILIEQFGDGNWGIKMCEFPN